MVSQTKVICFDFNSILILPSCYIISNKALTVQLAVFSNHKQSAGGVLKKGLLYYEECLR